MKQSRDNDLEENGENESRGEDEEKEEVKGGEKGELERRVEDVENSNISNADNNCDEYEGRKRERIVSDAVNASSGFGGRTVLKDDEGDDKEEAKSILARDTELVSSGPTVEQTESDRGVVEQDSGVVGQTEDMVTPDLPNQDTSGNDPMSQIHYILSK